MISSRAKRLQTALLLVVFFISTASLTFAAGLNDLFGKKEIDEEERQQTIERIESIQEKLQLLQDKLRALERRKAANAAAERAEKLGDKFSDTPVQVNWVAIDDTTVDPGGYGLYTYLLFNGQQADYASLGILEDFILTIETLPANDIPASLANQFLIPVEKPQSIISLGRQPYDFDLNQLFISRLNIPGDLPVGPVLVSTRQPVDPYGSGDTPDHIAVGLGKQAPERAAALAEIFHGQEKDAVVSNEHAVADLFWELIDGAGPVTVSRSSSVITVALPQ